jgi:hypothetical protein
MLRRWIALLVLAGCLAVPAEALANAYSQVQDAYVQSGTTQISPCEFSSAELEAALTQAPSYNYQYESDFTDAIQVALAARADGDCARAGSATVAVTRSLGPGSRIPSADTQLPRSLTAAGSGGLPPVLLVAFILIGAFLVCLGGWLGVNGLGAESRVIRAARHSLREAEYRIAAGWDDLADRLRR